MFANRNVIVLDLETARSADDCRHCGEPKERHGIGNSCHQNSETLYEPIGWTNKPALGLSIGGYYSYADERVHWFDEHTLARTVGKLADEQPLMVSFNGIQFDFPLMRGILRQRAEALGPGAHGEALTFLCDKFKDLAANSYDILAEIWKADPASKFTKGLNSLDAIAQANGLGAKIGHGAQAPRDFQAGRIAQLVSYCQDDIVKTKALFEQIVATGGMLWRSDGEIALRWINPDALSETTTQMPF